MTSVPSSYGSAGALFDLSGTVPTNATWSEDIYFTQDGAAMDISGLDWKFTFRSDGDSDTADFTLSIDDGTLTVVADDDGYNRVLRIAVPAGTLNNYSGDYVADLAAQDVASKVTLWAHGIVTFRANPVAF